MLHTVHEQLLLVCLPVPVAEVGGFCILGCNLPPIIALGIVCNVLPTVIK